MAYNFDSLFHCDIILEIVYWDIFVEVCAVAKIGDERQGGTGTGMGDGYETEGGGGGEGECWWGGS